MFSMPDLANVNRFLAKMSFSGKRKVSIYKRLSNHLKGGKALGDTLRLLLIHAIQAGRREQGTVMMLREWIDGMNNGRSFGRVVEQWVPPSDHMIITAGESGNLADALDNVLKVQESSRKLKSAIISGLSYPSALYFASLGLLVMFSVLLVPRFEELASKDQWTGVAYGVVAVSAAVTKYIFPILFVAIALAIASIYSMPRWTGPTRAIFDRYPPWSLYRLTYGAGFMLSMSAMLKAGVPVGDILRTLKIGANPWYAERLNATLNFVNDGKNVGEALYLTGLRFPDFEAVIDIRSYADSGNFDQNLDWLANRWLEDSVEKVQLQTAILRNLGLAMLGGIIIFYLFGLASMSAQLSAQ
jgi:type II secretory pathway component PulF